MSEERKFAGGDELGDDSRYDEIELPMLGKWVRVRFLETAEVARLSLLPDLVDFVTLVNKFAGEQKELTPDERAQFVSESYRYSAHVAHLAVVHPESDDTEQRCDVCGFEHQVALWSVTQAGRLQPQDLEAITNTALRGQSQGLASVRPFSRARTRRGSPGRARTTA